MTRDSHIPALSRRGLVLGAAATAAAGGPAQAVTVPRDVERHPGYRAWQRMAWAPQPPLDLPLRTPDGRVMSLRQWNGGGPTVLVMWASWCAPCLAEKPAQAFLTRRLRSSRSPTKLKLLQAFDDLPLATAVTGLERLGARGLDVARASPELEQALTRHLGPSKSDPRRTPMPSELLLAPDGSELGRGRGSMIGATGQSYWGDVQTFQFLMTLGQSLRA